MSWADFVELIALYFSIAIGCALVIWYIISALYIYFDVEHRSKSRAMAVLITVVAFYSASPELALVAYLAVTTLLDIAGRKQAAA